MEKISPSFVCFMNFFEPYHKIVTSDKSGCMPQELSRDEEELKGFQYWLSFTSDNYAFTIIKEISFFEQCIVYGVL